MSLFGQFQNILTLGGTRYACNGITAATAEREASVILTTGNVIATLRVFSQAALPLGTSVQVNVLVNGVATPLTVTIHDTDGLNTVSDMAHYYIPAIGDRICFQAVPSLGILLGMNLSCSLQGA